MERIFEGELILKKCEFGNKMLGVFNSLFSMSDNELKTIMSYRMDIKNLSSKKRTIAYKTSHELEDENKFIIINIIVYKKEN